MKGRSWGWVQAILGSLLLLVIAVLLVEGLHVPDKWVLSQWGGLINGSITQPPFPLNSTVQAFPALQAGSTLQTHHYLLGSDAGGRDLLGLTARGAIPSAELVGLVLVARLVIGLVAGLAMANSVSLVATLARAAGGWIAGFPYLALAVLVIQAFTGGPSATSVPGPGRLIGFIVAMAVVGWRDLAQVVSDRITWVRAQPFALGAQAVGTGGLGFFRRYAWPYLRAAIAVEISFQASAVLVLLAELGFLQYYLGGFTGVYEDGLAYRLANQPELGQLLSDVRIYAQRQELAAALVPALAIALAALAFELFGRALRGRADLPA